VVCVVVSLAFATTVLRGQEWQTLALASFDDAWQTIRDNYYDPTFGGTNWSAVRDELRPLVQRSASMDVARGVTRQMLARLRQSHFTLLSPSSSGRTPGDAMPAIQLRVVDGAVVVYQVEPGSAAERVGLHPGHQLLAIDGRAVEAWRPSIPSVHPRDAALAWWRELSDALRGPTGSTIRLRLRGLPERDHELVVEREQESGTLASFGNIAPLRVRTVAREARTPRGRRVGVIGFNLWFPAVAGPIADAIDTYRQAEGLIIDLRGNPGGLAEMMRGIAGHLLAEPALLGRMQMRATTLEFRANPRRSTADGRHVEPFSGPVAILIDELTGSTSECFAGGLQSLGRARVFGARSMGQALPAATRQLPDGDVLLYVVGDFTTSTGQRLEGAGVVPDVEVPLTRSGLVANRDDPTIAALQWIDAVRQPVAPARP
jgi:carboxyl-terminal processing protease